MLDGLQNDGHRIEILFLEAREDVLVRRFSETRRRHPLATDASVPDGIRLESQQLEELRRRATYILDTSDFNVHELRDVVQTTYSMEDTRVRMQILVMSFGYKYGVPYNTDLVFDVRFLPNPHFDPELRPFTGRDPRVARA